MSWLAWATLWWIGLGVALAVVTQSGEVWRKWWVRVAALLLSLTTLDQLGSDAAPFSSLLAASPRWVQQITASFGNGCGGIGAVAQLACNPPVAAGPVSARSDDPR